MVISGDQPALPAILEFDRVAKRYAQGIAVDGVTLGIRAGSFTALVGSSGSGKSTLLRIANGLIRSDAGHVLVDGQRLDQADSLALRRRFGFVFQSIALFPHMTVAANVGIGLTIRGQTGTAERVAAMLELVELDPALGVRRPEELSGGQQQRVGIARALAPAPEFLLLDEPFGALDPVTRDALGQRIRALHDSLALTTVLVTHDMVEALLLADRVLVMDQGRIVADEPPGALLAGAGGDIAQGLLGVHRRQSQRLAQLSP